MYYLGDAGASEVSLALQLYPIVILNVEKNNIGFDGCKAICSVLASNATLTRLYLSSNKIGLEGCFALSMAITSATRHSLTPDGTHLKGNSPTPTSG